MESIVSKKNRMKIIYPDGTVIEGKKDLKTWTDYLNITDLDFTGKRVLDIATDEGWWAFWSEMQGAEYVEASDVETGQDYDWGAEKDWEWINWLNSIRTSKQVFDKHYQNLNSNIVYKKESIYDIKGKFDFIFCHGLLYHLRHPLLAFDTVSRSTQGFAIFETFTDIEEDQMIASSKFYRTTELSNAISNWTGATTAGWCSWMRDAGFKDVYYTTPGFSGKTRQMLVGVKDTKYKQRFDNCENLHYCDDEFWNIVFEKTKYRG